MAHGLFIKGDSGNVQVDETSFNFALAQKYSSTTTTPNPFTSTLLAGFSSALFPDPMPSGNGGPILFAVKVAAPFFVSPDVNGIAVQAPVGTPYTLYLFTIPPSTKAGSYGLLAKTAAGGITFDTGRKYMDVDAQVVGANYQTALPSATLPSGNYAVLMSQAAGRAQYSGPGTGGGPTYDQYGLFAQMSATTLTTSEKKYAQYTSKGGMPTNLYSRFYAFLIIDVSML